MSWVITGKEAGPADPFIGSVSLLLHGDGANGSTAIIDSSPSPKTLTAVGDAQISTAQSKFGGASLLFDGSGDALTVPKGDEVNFGLGDFTIEAWIRFSVLPGDYGIVAGRGPTAGTLMFAALATSLRIGRNNIAWDLIGSTSWVLNVWYHVAVTRESGTLRIFKDGLLLNSGTYTGTYTLADTADTDYAVGARQINVLSSSTLDRFFNGYIDDLRITKGVARYTANFTPPTAPFPDI
jgi:hypothetical protein